MRPRSYAMVVVVTPSSSFPSWTLTLLLVAGCAGADPSSTPQPSNDAPPVAEAPASPKSAAPVAEDAGDSSQPDAMTTPDEPPPPVAAGGSRCAVVDDTKSIHMWAQGGHAAAVNDLHVELASREMTGKGFRLDGAQPVAVPAHRTLTSDELQPLVAHLRSICGTVEAVAVDRHAAPGGMSRYEVHGNDGRVLVLVSGAASTAAAGESILEVEGTAYRRIAELWPAAAAPK